MKELIAAFEDVLCVHDEPCGMWVARRQEMSQEDFRRNCALLEDSGFVPETRDAADGRCFRAYRRGNDGVFLNYYPATKEITVVFEENSPYFSFTDTLQNHNVLPQITQVGNNRAGTWSQAIWLQCLFPILICLLILIDFFQFNVHLALPYSLSISKFTFY